MSKRLVLLLVCPDQPGIVAHVSHFIFKRGGNIIDSDQHTDFETRTFFMRIEWEMKLNSSARKKLEPEVARFARRFQMKYELFDEDKPCRMAIFVSKQAHCLYDLLVRLKLEELHSNVELIVSNHLDLKSVASHFDIPFYYVPVSPDKKKQAEKRQLELLKRHQVNLIVLARYMQVLSPEFVKVYPNQMINIHHSFLPAFAGAKPYHQAYARGVKLIGATSHYVTEDLDEGPIIGQSVTRVSHRDRVEDLVRKGRDQEKVALAYAVKMHLEHRILAYENKTIVFE